MLDVFSLPKSKMTKEQLFVPVSFRDTLPLQVS